MSGQDRLYIFFQSTRALTTKKAMNNKQKCIEHSQILVLTSFSYERSKLLYRDETRT